MKGQRSSFYQYYDKMYAERDYKWETDFVFDVARVRGSKGVPFSHVGFVCKMK